MGAATGEARELTHAMSPDGSVDVYVGPDALRVAQCQPESGAHFGPDNRTVIIFESLMDPRSLFLTGVKHMGAGQFCLFVSRDKRWSCGERVVDLSLHVPSSPPVSH